jgi:hypothetical protein
MESIFSKAKEGVLDCSICGQSINLIKESPDYWMGEPSHVDCANKMRNQSVIPTDIDDIIA